MLTIADLMKDDEHLLFVYGTLKRGQPNENIMKRDDIKYVGRVRTFDSFPLVIATTFNIPFIIDKQGVGRNVIGELYWVGDKALAMLDEFEGNHTFYERVKLDLELLGGSLHCKRVRAWAYMLQDYRPELLENPAYVEYDSAGAHGKPYISRSNRPPDCPLPRVQVLRSFNNGSH